MFFQNDQIHNNLHLSVENSIEIGKGYQVIEKWVFFKLFQILQTDSSGGKNHSPSKNTIYFLQGNLKNQINFIKIKYHDIKYRSN
jgi:hypothetical protein